MSYGRYFEELEPGLHFRQWPGRAITEFDDTLFSLISMNQHPLHIDENYAAGTQHRRRLVVGPLVISLVIGMSQADVGGRALEMLDYSNVRHLGPVFHAIPFMRSRAWVMREELPNERRAVTVSTHGPNQREETILTLQRKMVPKRPDEEAPCES